MVDKIPVYCPNCIDSEILPWHENCPGCYKKVNRNSFGLIEFLRSNYQLFAIIGVLGTLTALLPALAEKYYPNTPLTSIVWPQNFLLLSSLILNSLMFAIILSLLFIKTAETRKEELVVFKIRKIPIIKIGDFERVLFGISVFLPLLFTTLFLSNIFPNLMNLYSLLILLVMLILIYFLFSLQARSIFIKLAYRILTLFFIFVLIVGILSTIFIIVPKPLAKIDPADVSIVSDTNYFSPVISNSIGIGLNPTNISGKDLSGISFLWETNFGYFVDWNTIDNRVKLLGNKSDHNADKIFWTYGDSFVGLDKPIVNIRLYIKRDESGEILANKSVNLTWFDRDTIQF